MKKLGKRSSLESGTFFAYACNCNCGSVPCGTCNNCNDYKNPQSTGAYALSYVSEMKMLMKYRFDVDIDAFYISNYIQDGLSLNTFMPIKYIRQEQQDVEEKWEKFGEGIYYKSKITLLVENLIQTLNGYKEIEIL